MGTFRRHDCPHLIKGSLWCNLTADKIINNTKLSIKERYNMLNNFTCSGCKVYKQLKKKKTLEDKFNIVKECCKSHNPQYSTSSVGIHNYGLLHEIADALGMKNNSGSRLRELSHAITRLMRKFIEAGFPVKEYRIKCCSWTEKETWHPLFQIEE